MHAQNIAGATAPTFTRGPRCKSMKHVRFYQESIKTERNCRVIAINSRFFEPVIVIEDAAYLDSLKELNAHDFVTKATD